MKTPIDLQKMAFPREYNGLFADNDVFIDCLNKIKIFHYGKQILQAYIPSIGRGHNIIKSIKQFQEEIIFDIDETDTEVLFKFNAKYIDLLAPILKVKTSGADRSPFSTKNLPKIKYDIPYDDLEKYKSITSCVPKEEMLTLSKLTKSFLETLCTKKYPMKKLKEDMALKCLKGKEYIHSIGKWEDYLKYLEKELCS